MIVHKAINGSRQVAEAVKKASRALAQIRRTISNKETDTVIPIYMETVRPRSSRVKPWAPHLKKDINALEQVRHRATEMITLFRKLPYEQRLNECKLTTLEERRPSGNAQDKADWKEYQKIPSLQEVILYEGGIV